eukprot:gnl/MRDRNA2_/MRDRNA2_33020_c0_seq1.p1 gnl/MRDRNA2_/MRDRNA2_33020_c0~~gnl/MRDRNA2_/MRDRNA2_33020_c0_seq1.p1  ORF type:complete len:573 (+),score=139.52 gnl/MRDRNA2_/MRDRNA2_33020_c0_seq1:37-1755(+)
MKVVLGQEDGFSKKERQQGEAKAVSQQGNASDLAHGQIREQERDKNLQLFERLEQETALKKIREECHVAKLRASEAEAQFEICMKTMDEATIFQERQAQNFCKLVKEWAATKAQWEARDKQRNHDLEQAETKLEQFKHFAELSQSQAERLKGELDDSEREAFKLRILLEDRETEICKLKHELAQKDMQIGCLKLGLPNPSAEVKKRTVQQNSNPEDGVVIPSVQAFSNPSAPLEEMVSQQQISSPRQDGAALKRQNQLNIIEDQFLMKQNPSLDLDAVHTSVHPKVSNPSAPLDETLSQQNSNPHDSGAVKLQDLKQNPNHDLDTAHKAMHPKAGIPRRNKAGKSNRSAKTETVPANNPSKPEDGMMQMQAPDEGRDKEFRVQVLEDDADVLHASSASSDVMHNSTVSPEAGHDGSRYLRPEEGHGGSGNVAFTPSSRVPVNIAVTDSQAGFSDKVLTINPNSNLADGGNSEMSSPHASKGSTGGSSFGSMPSLIGAQQSEECSIWDGSMKTMKSNQKLEGSLSSVNENEKLGTPGNSAGLAEYLPPEISPSCAPDKPTSSFAYTEQEFETF